MLVINTVLLFLGMVMESGTILTLMLPVLLPIVKFCDINLVHFSVCLFTVADVGKIKLERLSKAVLPFIIPLVIVLFMCTYIPGLITWLPGVLMGR